MTITRAQIETILISRTGGLLLAAELDVTTVNGTNADLADPISKAASLLGIEVADVTNITDTELSGVAQTDVTELLDRAELATYRMIAGNLSLTDIYIGPRREFFSQLARQVQKNIDQLSEEIEANFGVGRQLQSGTLRLDFAEKTPTV